MKRLIPDTNIYGLLVADKDFHLFHSSYEDFKKIVLRTGFSNPFVDSSNKFGIFLSFFNILPSIKFAISDFIFHRALKERLIYKSFA